MNGILDTYLQWTSRRGNGYDPFGTKHVVNFADSDATGHVHMGLTHYMKKLYPEVEIPVSTLRARFADDHCGLREGSIGRYGIEWLTMEDHFGKMVDYYALDFAFAADEPRCEVSFEFVVNQS
ncbi:hypothetical protein PRECH8_03280 [Insulibacter thermoxylanivorax]|uniref:Uncharacterized protein n=1 Tax=Insulibacter thermoxylanivorax TaxID=2749268 RepID=A0A916QER2_9BACL|nr:hypothetical protein [Insulibacter thermoxylanivorax]GFR37032.1 hypothetical protein PRECH8_03280 [Insulibacter thermoxylanivorax]